MCTISFPNKVVQYVYLKLMAKLKYKKEHLKFIHTKVSRYTTIINSNVNPRNSSNL